MLGLHTSTTTITVAAPLSIFNNDAGSSNGGAGDDGAAGGRGYRTARRLMWWWQSPKDQAGLLGVVEAGSSCACVSTPRIPDSSLQQYISQTTRGPSSRVRSNRRPRPVSFLLPIFHKTYITRKWFRPFLTIMHSQGNGVQTKQIVRKNSLV